LNRLDGARSGRRGVVQSEVKEEGWASPGPGDMSGAQRPGGLIPRIRSRSHRRPALHASRVARSAVEQLG